MTRAIFVALATDKVSQPDAEAMTSLVDFWIKHHVAPAWYRTPTTVQFTSNAESAYEGSILIRIGESMAKGADPLHAPDSTAVQLSQLVAQAFLDPTGNAHCADAKGSLWLLDPCAPVKSESYVVSDGSKACTLSDFVLPAFYDVTGTGLLDYLGKVSKPFTVAPGGSKKLFKASK